MPIEEVIPTAGAVPLDQAKPSVTGEPEPPSRSLPSVWRAWCSLVWLSFWRQAKAQQMVWIALGLLAFAVVLVAINTASGRWGMHHFRYPRRVGPPYTTWVNEVHLVTAVVHRSPGAHAIQNAVLGSCQVILSPTARNAQGELLACSGFQVFSQWVVFSIFLTFLLPLWSLSFATEALGGERESQSLIWLLSRPIPRPAIYLAKFVALLPWSIGLNVFGFTVLCLAAGPPGRLALSLYWPAVVASTLAFASLFFLIGAWFRRPAVVAIVYSFCLEVVLGNMPGYLKRASIGFYTRCMMFESAEAYGVQPDKPGVFLPVDGLTALVVLVLSTLLFLVLGMWLFSRSQYHELD